MCKKVGHGTNYGGRPKTLATQAQVALALIEEFQPAYFRAFPAHIRWHQWTKRALIEEGYIVNLMGRKRWFWGKRDDDATLREALGYQGQALADIVNTGMLNVWRNRDAIMLVQAHDAILVQYPEKLEAEVIPKLLEQLKVSIPLDGGREFIIPYSVATGWNWGKHSPENPDGIKPWTGEDKRKRSPQVSILDRKFPKRYR
jgi:DNA polymerase I-like protein with 3'-5' exonuclease and polymerase domains